MKLKPSVAVLSALFMAFAFDGGSARADSVSDAACFAANTTIALDYFDFVANKELKIRALNAVQDFVQKEIDKKTDRGRKLMDQLRAYRGYLASKKSKYPDILRKQEAASKAINKLFRKDVLKVIENVLQEDQAGVDLTLENWAKWNPSNHPTDFYSALDQAIVIDLMFPFGGSDSIYREGHSASIFGGSPVGISIRGFSGASRQERKGLDFPLIVGDELGLSFDPISNERYILDHAELLKDMGQLSSYSFRSAKKGERALDALCENIRHASVYSYANTYPASCLTVLPKQFGCAPDPSAAAQQGPIVPDGEAPSVGTEGGVPVKEEPKRPEAPAKTDGVGSAVRATD